MEGSNTAEENCNNRAEAIAALLKHSVLLAIRKCNVHSGEDSMKHTYHTRKNSNTEYLLDLISETNHMMTNTSFHKPKGKLYTFLSNMTRSKSQIDYILIID